MVGLLDSDDSDWWDTYQSIDDEIRALCVHEDFNQLVRAICTAFTKILLELCQPIVSQIFSRVCFNCGNVL